MGFENISSLQDAKEAYIPVDIAQSFTEVPREKIRQELYKRTADVTETLVTFAETHPDYNLTLATEMLLANRKLSEKQREFYRVVRQKIELARTNTDITMLTAKAVAPIFIQEGQTELERLGIEDIDPENEQVLGTLLFFASTGELPLKAPRYEYNPLFIKLHVVTDEDMKTIQRHDQNPGGFFRKSEDFNFSKSTRSTEATLVVIRDRSSTSNYFTEKHERYHFVYEMFAAAAKDLKLAEDYKDMDSLLGDWEKTVTADDAGFKAVWLKNLEREGEALEQVKNKFFERAKNEILTRYRTGDVNDLNLSSLPENEDLLNSYLEDYGSEEMKKIMSKYTSLGYSSDVIERTIKGELRSITRWTNRVRRGLRIAGNVDGITAFESMLETKPLQEWGDEISKVYKENTQHYLRLGTVFNKLQKEERYSENNPNWKLLSNVQNALQFMQNNLGYTLEQAIEKIEPSIIELEERVAK